MERSDTLTLGTLAQFRHFRHLQTTTPACAFHQLECPSAANHVLGLLQVLALFKKDTQIG